MANTKSNTLPRRFTPRFWSEVDGRLGVYKEIQGRYVELVEDTGSKSAQKLILCQRAVFIAIQLETMEVEAATNGKFDFGVYTQGVNALSGLLSKLGLEKQAKDVQTVASYVSKNGNGRAKA